MPLTATDIEAGPDAYEGRVLGVHEPEALQPRLGDTERLRFVQIGERGVYVSGSRGRPSVSGLL